MPSPLKPQSSSVAAKTEIHDLTRAEISRQIAIHEERRREIVAERAAIYTTALKSGSAADGRLVDDDERAARALAKALLNGYAPASLSIGQPLTRDRELAREQRGLDIVLRILNDKNLVALAVEAVEWAEANRQQWSDLCRYIVLARTRLEALEKSACTLFERCPDRMAVNLPMTNFIGSLPVSSLTLSELQAAALTENIVTKSEIKKAQTC